MAKIIGLILLFAAFGILVFGVFLGRVIRTFRPSDRNRSNKRRTNNNSQQSTNSAPVQKKFAKGEGEYISYEEVKDDK